MSYPDPRHRGEGGAVNAVPRPAGQAPAFGAGHTEATDEFFKLHNHCDDDNLRYTHRWV